LSSSAGEFVNRKTRHAGAKHEDAACMGLDGDIRGAQTVGGGRDVEVVEFPAAECAARDLSDGQ
jgi:hypothetical protein